MSELIAVERDGHVAWLTFASGLSMNVITLELLQQFHAALDAIEGDPPRVLMIAGSPTVFSGGADLATMRDMDESDYQAFIEAEYALFRRVDGLPFLTIAVISGPCIGNAAELTLACDLRIASRDVRWGLPETKVGFPAPAQRLSRFLGIGRAKEIVYLGLILKGEQMEELGLINQLVADADLTSAAQAMASRYASCAPLAVRHSKAALGRTYHVDDNHDAAELFSAITMFRSADFQEGATAILERRTPNFKGL